MEIPRSAFAKGTSHDPEGNSNHLHHEPGDRIKFFVHPDGSVVILPKISTSKLKGIVKARRRASFKDMETAIGEAPSAAGSAPDPGDRSGYQRSRAVPSEDHDRE